MKKVKPMIQASSAQAVAVLMKISKVKVAFKTRNLLMLMMIWRSKVKNWILIVKMLNKK